MKKNLNHSTNLIFSSLTPHYHNAHPIEWHMLNFSYRYRPEKNGRKGAKGKHNHPKHKERERKACGFNDLAHVLAAGFSGRTLSAGVRRLNPVVQFMLLIRTKPVSKPTLRRPAPAAIERLSFVFIQTHTRARAENRVKFSCQVEKPCIRLRAEFALFILLFCGFFSARFPRRSLYRR